MIYETNPQLTWSPSAVWELHKSVFDTLLVLPYGLWDQPSVNLVTISGLIATSVFDTLLVLPYGLWDQPSVNLVTVSGLIATSVFDTLLVLPYGLRDQPSVNLVTISGLIAPQVGIWYTVSVTKPQLTWSPSAVL